MTRNYLLALLAPDEPEAADFGTDFVGDSMPKTTKYMYKVNPGVCSDVSLCVYKHNAYQCCSQRESVFRDRHWCKANGSEALSLALAVDRWRAVPDRTTAANLTMHPKLCPAT